MIDLTQFDTAYLPDIILILISGSACLYCGMLNRRLKKLQNLKTGVGASIVSLTDAITQTNKAAKDAQSTTLQTVETLRHLLAKSEAAAPKIDALLAELAYSTETAKKQRKLMDAQIEGELIPSIDEAQLSAANLLKAVSDVDDYVVKIKHEIQAKQQQNVEYLDPAQRQYVDKFSVISS